MSGPQKNIYTGIGLAVLAALIWSEQFYHRQGVSTSRSAGQILLLQMAARYDHNLSFCN